MIGLSDIFIVSDGHITVHNVYIQWVMRKKFSYYTVFQSKLWCIAAIEVCFSSAHRVGHGCNA